MHYGSRRIALIGLGVLLAVAGGVLVYVRGAPQPGVFLSPNPERIHYAGDETRIINKIHIRAIYFAPADLAASLEPSWKTLLEQALEKLERFYSFQLQRAVTVTYDIYPEPVIGEEPHQFYDGQDTSRGNPHALLSVREELLRRQIFAPRASEDTYEIMAILYEGVGSSATIFDKNGEPSSPDVVLLEEGPSAFLVSRFFLSDEPYRDFGPTIFAHEFTHTLGLPDSYDALTGQPTTDDIMGLGRFRPLEMTYLSSEAKQKLGLNQL